MAISSRVYHLLRIPVTDSIVLILYEHLSLQDLRIALINSFRVLKTRGIFRCVLPDLEFSARKYIEDLDKGDALASLAFMRKTLLGTIERPRGLKGFLSSFLGNSHHLWMWDSKSLPEELNNAGFTQIRVCKFNDCEDEMFKHVEDIARFKNELAIECRK